MAEPNRKSQKRPLIQISSSSEEESSDDDHHVQDITSSEDDDDDDESEWNESMMNYLRTTRRMLIILTTTRILCTREQSDSLDLSLKDCKAYLRKNGLRLSGTKLECIRRIEEHRRLEDGNGEALYPRSSFSINCTGDVCKGDVVLFTQKVYKKFDKVTRSGSILGKRTIAGRIVKESYGAAKQQHTFTVEVLWSKGVKNLSPLLPLLVKGRNLYRLKTFRQRWENEGELSQVLDEKHKRGAAARSVRARRMNKKASRKKGGSKLQKHSHQLKQHEKTEFGKENRVNVRAWGGKRKSMSYNEKPHPVRHLDSNRTREPIVFASNRHQMLIHPNHFRESSFQYPHPYPSPQFYHGRPETHYPHMNSYSLPFGMPVEHQETSRFGYQRGAPSTFAFRTQSRNFNHFPNQENEAAGKWW